jgi:hypothetical protein
MNNLEIDSAIQREIVRRTGYKQGTHKLIKTDWLVTRHRDQKELGIPTSLSEDEYLRMLKLRQFWRDTYSREITKKVINLPLSKIVDFSPLDTYRLENVKQYKELFENGEIPPPIYIHVYPGGGHFVQDGHRRVQAAKELGIKTLPAIVWDFT